MNHLAHFFLAGRSAEAVTGALLGDFVKGKMLPENFPAKMRVEIMIHRHVDAFTDSDERILHSKDIFKNTRRRFAGIALDVAFDHFLVRNWKVYTKENLREFADEVYVSLEKHHQSFHFNFQPVLQRMIADDWLFAYRNFERVGLVLQRMSLRVRGGESLAQAFDEIKANYDFFDEVFKEFFPRLQDFVKEKRAESSFEKE